MTPESREILRKWLDQGGGWLKRPRPRESVTADEVIAKIREVPWPDKYSERFGNAVIESIETTIAEICNPGTKERPDADSA